MSEPMAEQAAQDNGAVEATAPQAVEAAGIEAPSIAPDHEAPPKPDPIKVEPPKIEVPKFEAKVEPKAETKPEPKPGKLIVMAPSERSWDREEFAPHVKADEVRDTGSKRRLSAMAAVVASGGLVIGREPCVFACRNRAKVDFLSAEHHGNPFRLALTGIEVASFHSQDALVPGSGSFSVGHVHHEMIEGVDFDRHGMSCATLGN